ncbi:AfsR/SARP family transcriptional regulator [Lentzea nigeriaca]|uniref:AfsR/SARP family transcriptional regulator n=1 Tax=Lentzea nigeriaca TaxID=1128665 RepID=UPI00195E5ECE|nr:BTAD domain-containing putative transcriptional regulator [Lentzea nigeriaca]MBM7863766.1 DNA-binding SARP family transcriptional activator/tetratricopeptide (TPR) repeat protein [Lentzea nigeriaca]
MVLEYRMLGPLELRRAGSPVELGGERQQKLLAVLLLNPGSVVSFDRLVDELWDDPPQTARRQVSNAAAGVRRVIGAAGGRLVTTTHGYRVQIDGETLDTHVFRALVRDADAAAEAGRLKEAAAALTDALALWRGPLLDGLVSSSITAARDAMAEQRLVAVERLALLRLELDDPALVAELVAHVAENPFRESLRATLMRALYRAGRQGDALAVFEEGRRLLAEELGADPGPELRALHERMLRSEPTGELAQPLTTEPVGSFLPYDTPDFTGRGAEVEQLLASAADGLMILVVEGMGGVGKTALAVHVAHLLVDRYPDGQYFVDLRGHTDDVRPMTADEAVDALLWQTGVPAHQMPGDPASRRDRWRERTAGKRVLVLLDNAADSAQVRPLLPGGPRSLVLVTSRRQLLDLPGAVPLPLDVLERDGAVELFGRIASADRVNAEREATEAVVALCGGLPLAVRIAASRFRRRPKWTMADLADQLRDRRRRDRTFTMEDQSVSGVIALSYRHLNPVRQRLFRLLGLVPGHDFDAYVAAALTGMSPADAEDVLEALLETNLVMQRDSGRYCLHDLVRDCARGMAEQLSADEVRGARHRLFDHYLGFAEKHCALLTMGYPRFTPEIAHASPAPAPDSAEVALRGLRAEHRNFVAVVEHAATHGWLTHAWQLPCALVPYFQRIGQRAGVLELADQAVRAAREQGDQRGLALAWQTVAFALREQGRSLEVRDVLERSVAICRELDDLPALAGGLRDLGVSLLQAGDLTESALRFEEARQVAQTLGDADNSVNSAINLGIVACQLGMYDRARLLFEQALVHHQRVGSVEGEAITLINIGWLEHNRERDEFAVDPLDRAIRLSRTIGFVRGEVVALSWLSVTYRAQGRLDEAKSVAVESREAARSSDLHEPECDAITAVAEADLAAGRLTEAQAGFHEAERVSLEGDLPLALARAREGLAHVAAALGEHDRARNLWGKALPVYHDEAPESTQIRAHLVAPGDKSVLCSRCRTRAGVLRQMTEVLVPRKVRA